MNLPEVNKLHYSQIFLSSGSLAEKQPAQLQRRSSYILAEDTPPIQRCIGTQGTWCLGFHGQQVGETL